MAKGSGRGGVAGAADWIVSSIYTTFGFQVSFLRNDATQAQSPSRTEPEPRFRELFHKVRVSSVVERTHSHACKRASELRVREL